MIWLNGTKVQFETFPNGETNLIADSIHVNKIAPTDTNKLSFKYTEDGDLIKLMFVKKHIDSKLRYNNPCHLHIYYMPYSRMDRSEGGSVFTLKYVSEFINGLGFTSVKITEPHSDVSTALVDRSSAHMVNEDLITLVMNEVNFDLAEDYLVYPDAGAQKRYAKFFDGNVLVGQKDRDFKTGRINKLDVIGDYNGTGKKAIIVDDLSSYGGTFLLTAEKLKEIGFEEIYLLVAHAENTIFEGGLFKEDLINKVFTTDTHLIEGISSRVHEHELTIYPIDEMIE